jgi:tight adherence protein C
VRLVLALFWGALAAAPLVGEVARGGVVARARELRTPVPGSPTARSALRRRERRKAAVLEGELALAADLLAVAVGAGLTPYLAVRVAARWGPPAVAARLAAVVHAADRGAGLAGALEAEAAASPALGPLLEALAVSERLGAPVGPVLTRIAAGGRARARQTALARARRVPVRLLFPLVFLVLPAFLLLTVAPVALAGLAP